MKKILLLTALIIFSLSSAFCFILLQDWNIATGYYIKFEGKYAEGTFDKMDGKIHFDPNDLSNSKFDVSVDVNSINTGKELKNKHAKGDKWFDAEKYPTIHFVSSQITVANSAYVVSGELELHGIKKPISIPFTFENENGKAAFHGKFKVNRGDFGIGKTTGKESDSTSVEVLVPVMAQ